MLAPNTIILYLTQIFQKLIVLIYSIHTMNIRKINLNLLIALDALLTEQNVSRAAQKIFITQPAMSNALTQLRELFQDELLTRSGKKMLATPLAIEIAPKIRQILQQIEETVTPNAAFNPATSKRNFKIGMSDYAEFILLPKLFAKLTKKAPNISLKIIHANVLQDPELFTSNKLDFGIGVLLPEAPFIAIEKLFTEAAICAARKDHPAIAKLTLKKYLTAKHLAICYDCFESEPILATTDQALEKAELKREIALAVPHMVAAMHMLPNSDLIATVPKHLALSLQHTLKLSLQKPPLPIPDITIAAAWHKRLENDAGHQWLKNLIKEAASEI